MSRGYEHHSHEAGTHRSRDQYCNRGIVLKLVKTLLGHD